MKDIFDLFLIFSRIGGLTFGGGYAMLPMIQKEIVEKHKWATEEEVLNYYALGQCTPGIIAINTATYIGYKKKGVWGGIAASLGMVFPSLIIITTIALFFYQFQDYKIVANAFNGIKIGVIALIVYTVAKMWQQAIQNYSAIIIFIISFLVFAIFQISPIIVIISSIIPGILIYHNK